MSDLNERQAAIDAIRKLESGEDFNFNNGLICAMNNIDELPSAQPTEASCWGCNCPKMERLKEQKTFSEMVHLHDAETHEERTETHGVCLDTISRRAAIDAVLDRMDTEKHGRNAKPEEIKWTLERVPSAQPEPQWIPCSECMYWRDERVLMNNGKARQYNGDEPDELGIKHSVSVEVGINQGAMCLYEEDRGWRTDHTTFRNADDFCSRAKKRPCSYEEWYGIVDGVYAEPWRGEEHETD